MSAPLGTHLYKALGITTDRQDIAMADDARQDVMLGCEGLNIIHARSSELQCQLEGLCMAVDDQTNAMLDCLYKADKAGRRLRPSPTTFASAGYEVTGNAAFHKHLSRKTDWVDKADAKKTAERSRSEAVKNAGMLHFIILRVRVGLNQLHMLPKVVDGPDVLALTNNCSRD